MDFKEYFRQRDLIKTPLTGVHYEQKTTPDLLWCVAYVVFDLIKEQQDQEFTDNDIRESPIFNSLMQDYFSKPPQVDAENEYNKVSSYQLGVLAFSGVLEQTGVRSKTYKVKDFQELEYIAINDLNASKFLCEYTEKFIADNGFSNVFENYKLNPNQSNYLRIKEEYWNWALTNTKIRGTSRDHTYRVFNKIFNVYSYKNHLPGEDASNITTGPCPYSFLIYNRENFRDRDMPSGMTRQQYDEEILSEIDDEGFVETLLNKAKEAIKNKYNDSEITDVEWGYAPNRVLEVHHILPRHSYQQFSLSKENLIILTPDQHRSFAHNGNYRTINPLFQVICLKKKLENIIVSQDSNEDFYSYEEFISIVNVCYNWDLNYNIEVEEIVSLIDNKISELS